MPEYSTRRKRSSNEGCLGVLPNKKPKPEPEENKFMFMVLLLNGLNLTLQFEDVMENVDVFVTSECIHLYILCIVPRCLFREVSIM